MYSTLDLVKKRDCPAKSGTVGRSAMVTPTGKQAVSDTDVSPKKVNIQRDRAASLFHNARTRSAEVRPTIVVLMPWVDFTEAKSSW